MQQYYHILHHSPGLVHRFYHETSKLGRPENDGSMSVTTTMQVIISSSLLRWSLVGPQVVFICS